MDSAGDTMAMTFEFCGRKIQQGEYYWWKATESEKWAKTLKKYPHQLLDYRRCSEAMFELAESAFMKAKGLHLRARLCEECARKNGVIW